MAEIGNVKMTDEQFMLSMELGTILHSEGYDFTSSNELDESKIKSKRAHTIINRLKEISEE